LLSRLGLAGLLAVGGASQSAFAQSSNQPPASGWRSFVTVSPWFQGDADLDNGGDFRASGIFFRGGASRPVGEGFHAGLTLNYEYTDYRFSSPVAFGGIAPWDDTHRIGLGVPLVFQGAGGWSYLVTPSVDLSMEDGADTGESFEYGAVFAVAKRFDSDRQIGIGVGIFDRLEDTSVFPFLLVDWKLTERLRLVNPVAPGLTGGAGLELNYRLGDDWTVGGGGTYRSMRFRLDETGRFPNGIGEERGAIAFLHADRSFGRFQLNLYVGAVLAGRLEVENANGDTLVKEDFDPAPLVGGSVSFRF
jgi:hypothetical protein